jgi:hypothetical protein
MVRAFLHLPGITQTFVSIDFLVDTGSTDTYLHPQDATLQMRIAEATLADPRQWPNREPTGGIGGSVACYVQPAIYLFHHDDGQVQRITHEIHIVPPTLTNATFPSLLGMDILRHFRLSMDFVGQRLVLE